jgi:hypothetical protein
LPPGACTWKMSVTLSITTCRKTEKTMYTGLAAPPEAGCRARLLVWPAIDMCTLLKRSKNTSEKKSPLSGRTKAGFSQTNPERSVVPTSGEEAPKEGGLLPGGEGRPTNPEKNGQMDQEAQRLPRRDPQRVPRPLPLGRREGIRSQESGDRRQKVTRHLKLCTRHRKEEKNSYRLTPTDYSTYRGWKAAPTETTLGGHRGPPYQSSRA